AGLSAAIELAKQNIETNLISSQPSERAQSVLAEGGINAALNVMGEGDTVEEHFADTMRGGVSLADPNAVFGLVSHAPAIVERLSAIGVPFQMENGALIQRNFGGQKKKRTAYARSSTGKVLMTAMIDEARRYEAAGLIHRFPHHDLLKLRLEDGVCTGALVQDSYSRRCDTFPGAVILCLGGLNGLFPGKTTGTTQNTGDALAALFGQGVALANLEMIQYHPTTVQIPGKRMLISEAARGEGGRLFVERSGQRWYFMEEKYPALGNLMPRDVISREMARLDGQVYLDLTGLTKQTWREKLPDLRSEIRHYLKLDPARTPVPVSPGIHFFMGGVWVDEGHRTNLPGLYAAGECACQYHGANRLGGNSLLGAIYGGMTAARTAAEETALPGGEPTEVAHTAPAQAGNALELGDILFSGLGILRDQETMEGALERLSALEPSPRVTLGRAMLCSALARRESRGAHTRTDFPERDDQQYQRTTVAVCGGEGIEISFREIPARREAHVD
ncbi:MAG: FAD-binding protein, partial [Oscillospiraceae bacterium]|nr:FAD-binding protein [Oscillospiraceae bacterium]